MPPWRAERILTVLDKCFKPLKKNWTIHVAEDNPPRRSTGARRVIVEQDDGQRVDNFLLRELRGLPRSRIYRMLRKGEVRVNGGRVRAAHRLNRGDEIRIPPLRMDPGEGSEAFVGDAVLETLAGSILYEDEQLLVLDKPAGMAVHGGSGLSFGAIEALRRLRPGDELELVHRLDRDTSGCLMVAKSRRALLALHGALRDREVRKLYRAVVFGVWPRRTTTVRLPLTRYLTASGERRVRVAADGKSARTDIEILQSAPAATLVRARLHTGRTHQIRVHAYASGHPVVGDVKYATPEQRARAEAVGIRRLCLHAEELALTFDGRRLTFSAAVPDDFEAAWQTLQTGAIS